MDWSLQAIDDQKAICQRFGAKWLACNSTEKLGISLNIKDKVYPFNGLRHKPENGTNGWYIWGGEEFRDDEQFIVPLHAHHLNEWAPEIIQYLGLAPGWRFLIAPGYVDVWFDESLLHTE